MLEILEFVKYINIDFRDCLYISPRRGYELNEQSKFIVPRSL